MSIKYAILGLLHYSDMHGYRIKEHIEKNFGHMWTINFGQIYTCLRELEEESLVLVKEILPSEGGGPFKKSYHITEKGREDFAEWLNSSPEKQMLLRDPFLLRFPFFGFSNPDTAIKLIDEQIDLYKRQLEERENKMNKWQNRGVYVRLIAELGINFNEMYIEWLKHAREEIIKEREKSLQRV
jgi:DNA-binding PadR family transcriptional regulator